MSVETPELSAETGLQRPSRTRKALMSVLGGLGLFAGVHVFGAYTDAKANEQEFQKEQAENAFDLNRAKITWAINLDKNEQPEEEAE